MPGSKLTSSFPVVASYSPAPIATPSASVSRPAALQVSAPVTSNDTYSVSIPVRHIAEAAAVCVVPGIALPIVAAEAATYAAPAISRAGHRAASAASEAYASASAAASEAYTSASTAVSDAYTAASTAVSDAYTSASTTLSESAAEARARANAASAEADAWMHARSEDLSRAWGTLSSIASGEVRITASRNTQGNGGSLSFGFSY